MEKYKCKRCSRSFLNGRALGGHMKSHLSNLPIPPKPKNDIRGGQPSTETASWSSNSDDEENPSSSAPVAGFDGDQENPRTRTSPTAPDSDLLGVVQDRESETETNRNPTRRRSKRSRRQRQQYRGSQMESVISPVKKVKHGGPGPVRSDSITESVPVSSVSDGSMTTKEDEEVALTLMMLSLGKWEEKEYCDYSQRGGDDDEVNHRLFSPSSSCKKVSELEVVGSFKSKELVGGHKHKNRATVTATTTRRREILGKKIVAEASGDRSVDLEFGKVIEASGMSMVRSDNVGGKCGGDGKRKIYECPYCEKVFESGQAFGGHKRSHYQGRVVGSVAVGAAAAKEAEAEAEAEVEVEVAACGGGGGGSGSAANACSSSNKRDESGGWIDLNLPAPLEEDSNDHDDD